MRTGLVVCLLASSPLVWADNPSLSQTQLYRELASGCMPVDLATWQHPTRQVLKKYKVPLQSLTLCNNKTFPIYSATLQYDPGTGSTNAFYIPFEHDMAKLNGWHSFAIVDAQNKIILEIMVDKKTRQVREAIEHFQ